MKATAVGSFEAKTHLSQLLDRVEQGESIDITRRGRPVALLVPYDEPHNPDAIRHLLKRVQEERGSYGIERSDIAAWKQEGRRE